MSESQVKIEALGDDDDNGDKTRKTSSSARRAGSRADSELHGRLREMFVRIAERLHERGDDELSELIREDADVLAGGLVSFTRPFRAARTVVLGAIAVVEPLLAFWRVARELVIRWAERRERKAAETDATDATGNQA